LAAHSLLHLSHLWLYSLLLTLSFCSQPYASIYRHPWCCSSCSLVNNGGCQLQLFFNKGGCQPLTFRKGCCICQWTVPSINGCCTLMTTNPTQVYVEIFWLQLMRCI
jgi:hypothetical protein